MDICLKKIGFGAKALSWLESIGHNQAMHVISCVAKILDFAEENMDFFQGCGLYAVGSSLSGDFNDVDLVLAGLDFRAVVKYNKIFLMDPETLIEKRIIIKPVFFVVIKRDENGKPLFMEPVTQIKEAPDFWTNSEARVRQGIIHRGIRYDYNHDMLYLLSGTLKGFCSYHAKPSTLTEIVHSLFLCSETKRFYDDGPDETYLSDPFDYYGLGPTQKFLIYHFFIRRPNNLPGVRNSILDDVKPVDLSIHAENLWRDEWKRHHVSLRLPFLVLKEWPQKKQERKVITKLDYPWFIDPRGLERARADHLMFPGFSPEEEALDFIDID